MSRCPVFLNFLFAQAESASTGSEMGQVCGKRRAILTFFFLSGVSGLIYQIVWNRMLILVFGATIFAITTVLTAFMAGMALGSFFFGRLIDRRGNPLMRAISCLWLRSREK